MSIYARLALVLVIVASIAAAWWKFEHALNAREARGYARAQQEAKEVADAQAQRNRDLQRAAELRYTVQTEARDRFITKTVTEVRYATQPLAACPVPVDAVRLLNDAATCASENRPASCGAGEQMRDAKPAP